MSKFKVGDRAVAQSGDIDIHKGGVYDVVYANDDIVGFYDDRGDLRYRLADMYDLAAVIVPGDWVALKSGEKFTNGSFYAEVDSVTDDKVILKIGSWLPIDDVALATAPDDEDEDEFEDEGDEWEEDTSVSADEVVTLEFDGGAVHGTPTGIAAFLSAIR